ncbi:hypothetical protein [Crocosphaera subtropica]|uniref:hypothetical protein n=1 Tax=Crocosphaera subtropica TaxID=2546360 RepID=UPI00023139A3|nr:hypothetical protein [Crocosphaera subtropica]
MLDHPSDYLTILCHYLFYLIIVGLLSFSLTYIINNKENSGIKTHMDQTNRLILKQAENAP